jgi:aspartate/methionine/tyrosine aminotransferase
MKLTESQRMQAVQSPIIPVVGEMIRRSPGTISLGQGVVNYPPPPEAIAQLSQFLADPNNHKYQAVTGIPALLEAIATKLAAENGILVSDRQTSDRQTIAVTAGSNMAFINVVLAIADPGDEIILQTPYYFNHEMAIQMADAVAVCVATDENYQLQLDQIEQAITPRTKAIVTISPNNPTGVVYPESALRQVNQLCRARGIYHISDEAYEYFTYDQVAHFSPGAIADSADHTISLFSLSKAYGFASWRIGYMVLPTHLKAAVEKVQDTIAICPTVISQYAALGALQAGRNYCLEQVRELETVRRSVLRSLVEVTDLCTVPVAAGAFYCFVKVNSELHPLTLTQQLIDQFKVAVIPGMTFGQAGCYLRLSYGALQGALVAEGMERFVQGIQSICANV